MMSQKRIHFGSFVCYQLKGVGIDMSYTIYVHLKWLRKEKTTPHCI